MEFHGATVKRNSDFVPSHWLKQFGATFLIVMYYMFQCWCSESEEHLHAVPWVLSGEEQRWVSTLYHYVTVLYFLSLFYWNPHTECGLVWFNSSTVTYLLIIIVSEYLSTKLHVHRFYKLQILFSLYRQKALADSIELVGLGM